MSTALDVLVCSNKCGAAIKAVKTKTGDDTKLPRGWKRTDDDSPVCQDCWDKTFVMRSVIFPVAGPYMHGSQEERNQAWRELRDDLYAAWGDTTRVANWYTRELVKAEPPRLATDVKLAPAPHPYLYNEARALCPGLVPSSVTALLRAVGLKYDSRRFHAIWRCAESVPSFRYPVPLPCNQQSWSAEYGGDNVPVVSFLIAAGGKRIKLRLRGGPEFKRQLAAFRLIVDGKARRCELSVYARPASDGDHRPGIVIDKDPHMIVVKLVAWLPRKEPGELSGELLVKTSGDDGLPVVDGVLKRPTFWTYRVADGDPKHLCADHIRRWLAEHNSRLARTNDDLKHEKRWPKAVRDGMVAARQPWIAKHNRRMDSFLHESTTMLAKFAERQRVAVVRYDDTDASFAPKFPWQKIREQLAWKLSERGIKFESTHEEKRLSEEAADKQKRQERKNKQKTERVEKTTPQGDDHDGIHTGE